MTIHTYIHRYLHGIEWSRIAKKKPVLVLPRASRSAKVSRTSFILFFTCIGIPIYVVYFVCDSASEFGAMGSTSFFVFFSYPNLLLVFLNLLFLGTCIICFSQVLDFLWVFLILFYFSVPYFGLACDHGNSFLCLEE